MSVTSLQQELRGDKEVKDASSDATEVCSRRRAFDRNIGVFALCFKKFNAVIPEVDQYWMVCDSV